MPASVFAPPFASADALRAEEYARGSGIAVTNVCPGSVKTNVARNAVQSAVRP